MLREQEEGKRRLNVSGVLRILGVSRSGYNTFKKRTASASQVKKEQRITQIRRIHEESHEIYGAPKIAAKLRQGGDRISERTVGKYMREIGIRACYRKHRTRTTRDSDFSSRLKNILCRNFQPERPDAAWCTDITYIWTCEGFVYLASIMDLYSRKIISWTLGKSLETKWVLKALEKAKAERSVEQPLVIHSDREDELLAKGKLSREAYDNRRLLREVMRFAGWKPLRTEMLFYSTEKI